MVLPLHPRTRAALTREKLLEKCSPNLRLLDPLGYLDMVMLEKHARSSPPIRAACRRKRSSTGSHA